MAREQDFFELAQEILEESIVKLFEANGVQLQQTSSVEYDDTESMAGVIGFTGDQMRGTLVLTCSGALVEEGDGRADQRDWIGEMSNQLIGRIKNRFLAYGITIWISTPVALRGFKLELIADSNNEAAVRKTFSCPGGGAVAFFDAELVDGFKLQEASEEAEESQEEGELILF
ncbi:MAG: chemotaxis protein CheX [Deltaproteobacteria bacterium]|nr:chemotaxis protein CheX [Deltaproteobacteria bacterium]